MLRITVILLQINKITLEKNENLTKVLTENCFFLSFHVFSQIASEQIVF